MYFKYGPYTHDANELDLTQLQVQRMYSPRNRMVFKRHTLTMQGHLLASSQSDIKAKIDAMESAYRLDRVAPGDGDAGLYHDDGTRSSHFLDRSNAINGIRVLAHSFPKKDGGEYATGRNYTIVLQADFLADFEDTIYAFHEMIIHIGNCGPQWEWIPQFVTLPIQQTEALYTPERIIQHGSAVGIQAWPAIPSAALSAEFRHGNRDRVEFGSSEMIGRTSLLLFPVRWYYEFSVIVPTTVYPLPDYNSPSRGL